jgi:hypothetical protein
MVAFFLLAVILAAAAASLITLTRSAHDNERRVQATALMNRLHEELQALPWWDAVVYDGELGPLADPTSGIGATPSGTPTHIDGRELVRIIGPDPVGCSYGETGCNRRQRVPEAHFTIEIDGIEYEVFQAVSWADGASQVKRFTTVVRWEVLGRVIEERFESERAATAAEAGDPTLPRVIQFQVGPSPMRLVTPDATTIDRNEQAIEVVVRFSEAVDSAELRFYTVKDPATDASGQVQLEERAVTMTPTVYDTATGKPVAFATTISALAYRFPDGQRTFRAIGSLGGDLFTGRTSMEFYDGTLPATPDPGSDDGGGEPEPDPEEPEDPDETTPPPAEPVAVGTVTVSPTNVCMDADHRFLQTTVVSVTVTGMTDDDYDVSITYSANKLSQTQGMDAPVTISPSGSTFTTTFVAGKDHGFRVQGTSNNATDETKFTVTAKRRSDKGSDGPKTSTSSLIVSQPNNTKDC